MDKGKLIKHFRKRSGITLEELARGICSISYLSKFENGTIQPAQEVFDQLCHRLNIQNYDEILRKHEGDGYIKKQLTQWLQYIEDKDDGKAYQAHLNIQHYFEENNYHPLHEIYLLYQLIQLRYLLSRDQINQSSEFVQHLSYYQDLFPLKYIYYYKKFTGIFHYKQFHFNTAFQEFIHALSIAEQELHLDDADLYYYLALTLARLNKHHLSIEYAKKALDLFQSDLCYPRMIDTQMLLAINYNLTGDNKQAVDLFEKILAAESDQITDKERAMAYHNLAYTLKHTDHQKALELINQAIELKHGEEKLNSLFLKASILVSLHHKEKALATIQTGIQCARQSRDKKYYYKFYVLEQKLKGTMYEKEFLEQLESFILPLFKARGEYAEYLDFLELAGEVCYQLRHYKKASDYFKLAFETLKTIDKGGEIK
ncbi:helix-turn-helix protein [Melghiribacillus thermohalophilus]|uniref:Helix-turn-helix protein n=2 Tax=Melghiribacillus thermohalophilus TaxID=1324956 RepID=A0A4R3N5R4_9BACI|nr:helix-turn-helix protein [Melghiribacillus thermohalophilus]